MKLFLTLVLAILLMASVAHAQNKPIPGKLKNIEACSVALQIPSSARSLKRWGIDACMKVFRNKNFHITVYVAFSSTENDMNDFRTEDAHKPKFSLSETVIDGSDAFISTFYENDPPDDARGLRYASSLFVPKLNKIRGAMWIRVFSRNQEGQDIAREMFKSVRFVPSKGASNNSFNRTLE